MNTLRAQSFAQQYIQLHLGSNWCFKWDYQLKRFGSTQFRQRAITLSKPITQLNSAASVLEALRHEIAHALTEEREHSEAWREAAIKLGCSGRATFNSKEVKLPKIVG